MTLDPKIHQQLLELYYDLTPAAEAETLRRRIAQEPELAEAYRRVEQEAALLGEASRMAASDVKLQRPDDAAAPMQPGVRARRSAGERRPGRFRFGAGWMVGLAAGVMLILSSASYFYHRHHVAAVADEHLRLLVTGPAQLQPGATNRFSVRTTSAAGSALPAVVEYALFATDGRELRREEQPTGEDGRLDLEIPADVDVAGGARMEVLAMRGGRLERSDPLPLPAAAARFVTRLSVDKPLYRPGETVRYRSLSLGRFGLESDEDQIIHYEILGPSGAATPGSELEGVTDRGVGNGAFGLPPDLPGGEYTLIARSINHAFAEEKRTFHVQQYRNPRFNKELEFTRDSYGPGDAVAADFSASRVDGGAAVNLPLVVNATLDSAVVWEQTDIQASADGTYRVEFKLPDAIERGDGRLVVILDDGGTRETIAKSIPINLGEVEVKFYPEGGDLVAGVENRVYFSARDPLGEPVHIVGEVLDGQQNKVADLETVHEGMGVFTYTPNAGEAYALRITSPADVESRLELPTVGEQAKLVLSTPDGVFAASEPLSLVLQSVDKETPVVVAAYCRGVQLAQQALTLHEGRRSVELPLANDAGGVLRVTLFDYSETPPRPVAERLVYQRPARRLHVRAAGAPKEYAPGDAVELVLEVTDENDRPTAAVLGVSVVDEAVLSLAVDKTPGVETHFLLTTEVERPEELEDADFYLAEGAESAEALDLLLGVQGWRRFTTRRLDELQQPGDEDDPLVRLAMRDGFSPPPAVFDNYERIRPAYEEQLARYGEDRAEVLGAVSMAGGAMLIMLLVMAAFLKLASRIELAAPVLASAGICLAVGVLLVRYDGPDRGGDRAVAYRPFVHPLFENGRLAGQGLSSVNGPDFDSDLSVLEWDRFDGVDDLGAMRFMFAPADEFAFQQHGALRAEAEEALFERKNLGRWLFDDGRWGAHADVDFLPGNELAKRFADLGDAQMELPELALREIARFRQQIRGGEQGQNKRPELLMMLKEISQRVEEFRFVVREYSHEHQRSAEGVRADFAETLYWNPLLIADGDGRARVTFDLSDSVTTFRLLAEAHSSTGRLGGGETSIVSRIPFSLEPKLPLEVTAGDRIQLPLAVVNDAPETTPVTVELTHGERVALVGESSRTLTLAAGARAREYFELEVLQEIGQEELRFDGRAGELVDSVRRPLGVVAPGFPVNQSYGGRIEGEQEIVVQLPEEWISGTLEVALAAFPSTLADLEKGLESILSEPYGCFEQASTANYPNVLTLQYLDEHNVADPEMTRRAKELLKSGYGRLTGYESPQQGYEWFGGDPGHEALTAYGLMEFRDMAEVYDVDPVMLERTADWLLSRRDGQGGFLRNPQALDTFGGAPEDLTNAYIVWALTESGQQGLDAELKHVAQLAEKSDDAYLVALAAASLLNAGQTSDGARLLEKLGEAQHDDGRLVGKNGSITRSGGFAFEVETTALAALAWLKQESYRPQADRAIEWIVAHRQGAGGFGSTQATILALKAMVEYAKQSRATVTGGELILKRDGEVIGSRTFAAGTHETISIDGVAAKLKAGENRLAISLSGDNKMPYGLDIAYRTAKPSSDDACPLRLETRLSDTTVDAGAAVTLTAELRNITQEGQPMSIAVIGLPAGLEVRPGQLDEMKKAGEFDYYETHAREIVCYWRSLAPERQVELNFDLVAEIPGRFTAPASRAYLYYTAEQKQWVAPLAVEITVP